MRWQAHLLSLTPRRMVSVVNQPRRTTMFEENVVTFSSDPDALVFWSVSLLGTLYLLLIPLMEKL